MLEEVESDDAPKAYAVVVQRGKTFWFTIVQLPPNGPT